MLTLVSSNENKLHEFKRFGLPGLDIEKGVDLPEVDADGETVVLYKALAAGPHRIVEDTALHIDGAQIGVNIRWLLDDIANHDGKRATWEVWLGINDSQHITTYRGEITGRITAKYAASHQGFGFDNYFIPDGTDKTLYELEMDGRKDAFSARKKAIDAFLACDVQKRIPIPNIPQWNGPMQ